MAMSDWQATPRRDWRVGRARTPAASGYVERRGVRIFWEAFGAGDPAILILPTWSVLHAAHGRFQIADLARDHRVITFDGRGNGRSDRPAGPEAYADAEFVADALAVLDASTTERAVVVGCSLATHWLLRLAAEHPDRVVGAVSSGTNLPLAPRHPRPEGIPPFDAPYASTDGWAKWNAAYWRDHYEDFLRFFFSQVWTEPYSASVIEDCVAWGLETTPETLIDTAIAPGITGRNEALELASRVRCPVLVVHGGSDSVTPLERSSRLADATNGRLVILEGSGHCPGNRDPVRFDVLVRQFAKSLVPSRATSVRWTRAAHRPRRVLVVPDGARPDVARRDIAIARALRSLVPDVQTVWLAPHPVRALVEAAGEVVHAASDALVAEAADLSDGPDRRARADHRGHRMRDEALFSNFMVFLDLVDAESFDLVLADGAWQLDHYLHQNPELKRFAFAWLTDQVAWEPVDGETERDVALRADANGEMLALVNRFPRLRDLAMFLGEPTQLPDHPLGPGLPSIREWASTHFSLVAKDAADPLVAEQVAARLAPLLHGSGGRVSSTEGP